MNKNIQPVISFPKNTIVYIFNSYKKLSKVVRYSLLTLCVVLLGSYFLLTKTKAIPAETVTYDRQVKLALTSSLSEKSQNFPFSGTVTSVSEAVIRAESSGKLTRVSKSLGDKVSAGEVIASFENSAESASLLQAEGSYEAAKAGREIATLSGGNSGNSLAETKNTALNSISTAFNFLDDAVRVKTDSSFTDPKTKDCKLSITVPDSGLIYSLEAQRKSIESILVARDLRNRTLTSDIDLASELTTVEKEAQTIKSYLDDLSLAYAKAIPSQLFTQSAIDAGKTGASAARSEVTGAVSTVQAARIALTNSIAAKNIADKTSGTVSSSGSADASVKQALGAYNAALSRYEKTIIRSPLSGTLNSLTIHTGDFITAFTQIGVVSNNGSLEVKSFVSEDDAKRIVVGTPAVITSGNTSVKGVVTKIAPAIDPLTKKIEVKIALVDEKSVLLNGESVTINLQTTVRKDASTSVRIPLSALKMTPNGALVFTVENGVAKQIKVTEGAIFGDNIEIKEGLEKDIQIIVDARGLKDGMNVIVSTK